MLATELAEKVESEIHNAHSFDLKRALIMRVTDGLFGVELSDQHAHGDVYDLLESDDAIDLARKAEWIALVTCGWAKPVTNDDDDADGVPPSAHPERRRVRLVVLASRTEVVSVLRFGDNPDETIIDEGTAKGSLADAIQALMRDSKK